MYGKDRLEFLASWRLISRIIGAGFYHSTMLYWLGARRVEAPIFERRVVQLILYNARADVRACPQ
eukprot:5112913-Amphidinium_carterae.1